MRDISLLDQSNRISVLIIDDDPGMRLLLSKIIDRDHRFTKVAEADSAELGLEMYNLYKPQLILSDIDMPGDNGVACAKRIHEIDPMAKIVFITAHEQYMAEAFRVYAFDYIVKPFDISRLTDTLDNVFSILYRTHIEPIISFDNTQDKLVVKTKESYSFINMSDIILIQREDRATVIYTTNDGRYVTNEKLSEIMERLDNSYLIRSHKSYIINIKMISDIYVYGRWTYLARFKGTSVDALITSENFDLIKQKYNIK